MAWFREPPAHGAHGGGAAHEVGSNAAATPGSCHGGAMGQGPMAERTCKVRQESELSSPCPHRGPEEQRHLQRRSDLQAEMRQRQPPRVAAWVKKSSHACPETGSNGGRVLERVRSPGVGPFSGPKTGTPKSEPTVSSKMGVPILGPENGPTYADAS